LINDNISINQLVKIHTSCSSIFLMIYSLPRQQEIQLNTNPSTLTLKAKIFIVYRVGMLRILYSF
ncbi:hypothetical protein KTJ20_01995, partial [Acinetobacter ursingii]|uniref:hypothetical protein n=1 Tax=Acinetobacter ursingii TaxID=108980 RepID=UPI0021CDD694